MDISPISMDSFRGFQYCLGEVEVNLPGVGFL